MAREDTALAAATVLSTDRDYGAFEVAGPQTLTIDEIADIVAHTLGRSIRVEHANPNIVHQEMLRQGINPIIAGMVAMTEANQKAGHFDVSGAALNNFLGKPLRTLESFVRINRRELLEYVI